MLASEICSQYSVKLINAEDIKVNDMGRFLRQFQFVISGRHHINIFLMWAGVPFLPISTNTWKIEECMKLLNYPVKPVVTYSEFSEKMDYMYLARERFRVAAEASYILGRDKMKSLIKKVDNALNNID